MKRDWEVVKTTVDAKKPELSTTEIKKEIIDELDTVRESVFAPKAKSKIETILRRASPWNTAKTVGIQYVPNGSPSQACARLLTALRAAGVFVVPVGELEGFSKNTGGHGPAWVNEVLKKNLKVDTELDRARAFVSSFVG